MTVARSKWRANLLVTFLAAMACCNLIFVFQSLPFLRNGYQDFTIYYTGARLVAEGRSAALYDLAAQYDTQLRFTRDPNRRRALPYNHPPFEALLFAPLAWVGYWPAYLLWNALNLIMLAASAVLLRHFSAIKDLPWVLLVLGCLTYFPAVIDMMHGQDAILLLLVAVLALTSLDRGADAAAGGWLAAGLFRPQLVIPLVLLIAVRRWRVLAGFIPVALVLAGVSVVLTGWRGLWAYASFVLRVEQDGSGFLLRQVPNLRGIVGGLLGLHASGLGAALIAVSSVTVFAVAVQRIGWGHDSIVHSFCLASVTAILVSFHALSYDLTLLLPLILLTLSAFTTAEAGKLGIARAVLLLTMYLTVSVLLSVDRFCWYGLVLLWLFFRLLRIPANATELA